MTKTITTNELKKELSIDRFILADINKRLDKGVDYTSEQYNSPIWGRSGTCFNIYYTTSGVEKSKRYLAHLTRLRIAIKDFTIKLNVNLKYRKYPHIWVQFGLIKALRLRGYGKTSIAYILSKNRKTIYDAIKNFPSEKDIIANIVINGIIEEFNKMELK